MSVMRWLTGGVCLAALAGPAEVGAAYPDRPVKLIVQGAVASGPDLLTRLVAEQLERQWKQPIVVVNLAGAGGLIAAQAAARAEPDGYTLFVGSITVYVILPEMHNTLPFDLQKDFVQIGVVAQVPMMIAASPRLGVTNLDELAALSRRQPDSLFYAAASPGSLPHLVAEMWRERTGASMTFVPYPGATAGLQDLVGGRVSVIVESVGALSAAVKAGTVTPLAVASASRLPDYPELPTVAESTPGFTAVGWMVLSGPAGTAPDIVQRVSADLGTALADPGLQRRFQALGASTRQMTPAQTERYIAEQQQLWRPVVRRLGLKPR